MAAALKQPQIQFRGKHFMNDSRVEAHNDLSMQVLEIKNEDIALDFQEYKPQRFSESFGGCQKRKKPQKELMTKVLSTNQNEIRSKSHLGHYHQSNNQVVNVKENVMIESNEKIKHSPATISSFNINVATQSSKKSSKIIKLFLFVSIDNNENTNSLAFQSSIKQQKTPFQDQTNSLMIDQQSTESPQKSIGTYQTNQIDSQLFNIEINHNDLHNPAVMHSKDLLSGKQIHANKENSSVGDSVSGKNVQPKGISLAQKLSIIARQQQSESIIKQQPLKRNKLVQQFMNLQSSTKNNKGSDNEQSDRKSTKLKKKNVEKKKPHQHRGSTSSCDDHEHKLMSSRTCSTPPAINSGHRTSQVQTAKTKMRGDKEKINMTQASVASSCKKSKAAFYGNLIDLMKQSIVQNTSVSQSVRKQNPNSKQSRENHNDSQSQSATRQSNIIQSQLYKITQPQQHQQPQQFNPIDSLKSSLFHLQNPEQFSHLRSNSGQLLNNEQVPSQCAVKIRIQNRLIDLKELVRICNDHSSECLYFNKMIKDSSIPADGDKKKKKKANAVNGGAIKSSRMKKLGHVHQTTSIQSQL